MRNELRNSFLNGILWTLGVYDTETEAEEACKEVSWSLRGRRRQKAARGCPHAPSRGGECCKMFCRIRDVRLLAVLRALPTLLLGGGSRPRDHLVQRMVQRATWSKHKHARVRWRGRQRAYERPAGGSPTGVYMNLKKTANHSKAHVVPHSQPHFRLHARHFLHFSVLSNVADNVAPFALPTAGHAT